MSLVISTDRGRGWLVALTLLPLGVIALQLLWGLDGYAGYSLYKLALLAGPLCFFRAAGIAVGRDVLGWRRWRRMLPAALGLGAVGGLVFWAAYLFWGPYLLDEARLVAKFEQQFNVTAATVLLVAPLTILLNSLLEEFFYRAFSFGSLRPIDRRLAWTLPAAVFTLQHLLFIYHWVSWLPLLLAVVGLMVFSLVCQWLYARSGSIVAPWAAHMIGDLAMMSIAAQMLGLF